MLREVRVEMSIMMNLMLAIVKMMIVFKLLTE